MEDSRMGISAQGAGQGTDPPVPRCAFCTAWTGGSVPGFQAARLSSRIRNYGDVSKDRSLTVAALIGAPTVREGLLQNTRSYLRNGVLRGLTRLPWISGVPCRKFAGSPVCPRVACGPSEDFTIGSVGSVA